MSSPNDFDAERKKDAERKRIFRQQMNDEKSKKSEMRLAARMRDLRNRRRQSSGNARNATTAVTSNFRSPLPSIDRDDDCIASTSSALHIQVLSVIVFAFSSVLLSGCIRTREDE